MALATLDYRMACESSSLKRLSLTSLLELSPKQRQMIAFATRYDIPFIAAPLHQVEKKAVYMKEDPRPLEDVIAACVAHGRVMAASNAHHQLMWCGDPECPHCQSLANLRRVLDLPTHHFKYEVGDSSGWDPELDDIDITFHLSITP